MMISTVAMTNPRLIGRVTNT
ncbi:MAG: hypothetical protein V7640_848, partial [Betaproteobacteria bacterium]